MTSAMGVVEELQDSDFARDAGKVGEDLVVIVRKKIDQDNIATFEGSAEAGWRVGFYLRDDDGDVVGLVPMEDTDD